MMVAPSLAPSAHDGAGMRSSSGDSAIESGNRDELTNKLLCRSSADRIFDVHPRNAGVRVRRCPHEAGYAGKDVE